MFLLEWTASDLLMIALAAIVMIGTVVWLVPGVRRNREQNQFTQAEITAYDRRIPLYFLAAAVALVIGSAHIIVKNIPVFWQWLWEAGYGGHLFRDLSNSHIIIVGGGTVLLTGITWYLLPRLVNRPLFSNALAGASFWFTVIGVFGFYISWLVLGLVEGNLVRNGMDYMTAKELVGSWHTVPTRMTSSIMGVGYWTYVLNVFLTVWVSRRSKTRPFGHLVKFAAVSAGALFVGTVQGVIQVLPANADWIHDAGKFGQYVDPISHAHINLVTGMIVSLAAFMVYFAPRMGGKLVSKRSANILFWILVPGSLVFYLTFLIAGLSLGGAANGYGGIQSAMLAQLISARLPIMLAVAGSIMLIGFWVYFVILWRSLNLRSIWRQVKQATPAGFWLLSSLALVIGTFQGLLQAFPATAQFLTRAEEIPNIHAQLNMIGGVLLALIGLVYLLLPELVGQEIDSRLRRLSLIGIANGIAGYYVVTLLTGMARIGYMQPGMNDALAAQQLGWAAPAALMLVAIPLLVGFGAFGLAVYRVTRTYRREFAADVRQTPARFSGPMPKRLQRIPLRYVIGMEFIGGLFGWPGVGWLYAGQAMPAVALLLIGPAIAWALLPMLFSPFTDTLLSQWNWLVLLVWLPLSAFISAAFLALHLKRQRSRQLAASDTSLLSRNNVMSKNPVQAAPRRRVSRRLIFGTATVFIFLFSVPVMPWLMGITSGTTLYTLMDKLPSRASGAYLKVDDGQQNGYIKLFTWSFPLEHVPSDLPTLNPAQIQDLVISQRGLDLPDRYQLYHIHGENSHLLTVNSQVSDSQRELTIRPSDALEAGDYMLSIPVDGMFAGREFYYFRIDPQVTTLPVVATTTQEPVGTQNEAAAIPLIEVFPLTAMIISGLMAFVMLRRLRQKVRPHELIWTVAFAMFAAASGSQVFGDLFGWTAALARLYYVMGATLVVGWLGLGTWLLLVQKPRLRNVGVWSIIFLTGLSLGLVSLAPVDPVILVSEGWHALDKPAALTVITILLNTAGTFVLVGGALWSAWVFWRKRIMSQRMYGLILLAVGAMTVAAGGSLTRLGHQQYLYIAMSLGIGLMFWGYLKTIRPAVASSAEDTSVVSNSRLATDSA